MKLDTSRLLSTLWKCFLIHLFTVARLVFHGENIIIIHIKSTAERSSLICASLNVKLCICINHFTKSGQLSVRKIIKIVATRCQILRLKCTKSPIPLPGQLIWTHTVTTWAFDLSNFNRFWYPTKPNPVTQPINYLNQSTNLYINNKKNRLQQEIYL